MPRQVAAAGVDYGERGNHRHSPAALLECLFDAEEGRLTVEGVEDRLGHEQVHVTIKKTQGLLAIGILELVEGDRPRRRVADICSHGGSAVRWSHRPGHETWLRGVGCSELGRNGGAQTGRGHVHFIDGVLETVVSHGDRCGVERVGLDDVGARLQIVQIDALDHVRTGDAEQVVAAGEVARVILKLLTPEVILAELEALNQRPHGPVHDEQALAELGVEASGCVCGSAGRHIVQKG